MLEWGLEGGREGVIGEFAWGYPADCVVGFLGGLARGDCGGMGCDGGCGGAMAASLSSSEPESERVNDPSNSTAAQPKFSNWWV